MPVLKWDQTTHLDKVEAVQLPHTFVEHSAVQLDGSCVVADHMQENDCCPARGSSSDSLFVLTAIELTATQTSKTPDAVNV